MRRAVILANGTPPSRATLEQAVRDAARFVCADGGAETARAVGLLPEAVIGDFDSATEDTIAHFSAVGVRIVRVFDIEPAATEKAIEYVLEHEPVDEIAIYGATAGRLDHVLGNVSLLHKFADRVRLVLEDDAASAWLASGIVTLDHPRGTVVSFFAAGEPAERVTTENLRYPLTEQTLELGSQDSISNEITERPGRIRIGSGRLVVVVVKRP